MTSMVERVARAICKEEGESLGDSWQDYIAHARAAILAMREPSDEMIEDGARKVGWSHGRFPEKLSREELTDLEISPGVHTNLKDHAGHTWQAMIDAALSEEGERP